MISYSIVHTSKSCMLWISCFGTDGDVLREEFMLRRRRLRSEWVISTERLSARRIQFKPAVKVRRV